MRARIAGLALLLAGGAARAQDELARSACDALGQEAQALSEAASSASDAELRSRALALVRHTKALEGRPVRGRGVRLPWLAAARDTLESNQDPPALRWAARRLAGRVFFTCTIAAREPGAPAALDRSRLLSILGRPEYERRSPDDTLLYRLFAQLTTWFREVFSTNEGVRATAVSVRALFLVGACLAAGYLALRMARTALARRRAPPPAAAQSETLALDEPDTYRAQLGAALRDGSGREALRLGLLTLLSTFERLRLAAPGRAATNREIAEQLARHGGGEELARRAGKLFAEYDRVWYGLAKVSSEEARAFSDAALELCALASAGRGGPP